MKLCRRGAIAPVISCATALAALLIVTVSALAAESPAAPQGEGRASHDSSRPAPVCKPSAMDSPFIPVDSWIYPALMRLYGLGFIDEIYLGMRPYTRASVGNMLDVAGARIEDADPGPETDQAEEIYESLLHELRFEIQGPCLRREGNSRVESIYTLARGISGTPLSDSYHLGSTVINDYGRHFESGFNSYSGASGYVSAGRFLIYARGEFDGAPSATGYSTDLASAISKQIDNITLNPANGLPFRQDTIPWGPISSTTKGHILEAYASAHYWNHEILFGKSDEWLGPGMGAGMAYSNNADGIYAFKINRTEPLHVPGLSYITGPFRYEFVIGPLRGHTYIPYIGPDTGSHPNVTNPGDPWAHLEKISFRPTENLEFGFERTAIWGGKGHGPITLHTFLKSFFSTASPTAQVKYGRNDPGARFGAFDFSYRLPLMRKWVTLYTDAEAHDEVNPIDSPRRSGWRPGIYLTHVPGVPRLDLRIEGVNTDSPNNNSQAGRLQYYEGIQKQGYTNRGQLFGDWIGREGKGGQAWVTYHLSGSEYIQVGVRAQKTAKDFIRTHDTQFGTTLDDINFRVVKRIGKDFEINGAFACEHYLAPIYLTNRQTVTTTDIQLTWFPKRKASF